MRLAILVASLVSLGGCMGVQELDEEDFRRLAARTGARPDELVATFFSVGLGDGYLLELPNGRALLVDAGHGLQSGDIIEYLRARGIARLDAMLLTHPHWDHYGGMRDVLAAVPVGEFLCNGHSSGGAPYERLLADLAARGVPTRVLRRGDRLDDLTGPGTTIEVLLPDEEAGLQRVERSDENAATIVLRLTHGATRFLLLGDAEQEEEARLLALEGTRLQADVVKLGHHASLLSGTSQFLRTVHPRLAVAQGTEGACVPPFYPRPSPGIAWTLDAMGTTLRTTGLQGAVQVVSDGRSVRWSTPFGAHLPRTLRRS